MIQFFFKIVIGQFPLGKKNEGMQEGKTGERERERKEKNEGGKLVTSLFLSGCL